MGVVQPPGGGAAAGDGVHTSLPFPPVEGLRSGGLRPPSRAAVRRYRSARRRDCAGITPDRAPLGFALPAREPPRTAVSGEGRAPVPTL